MYKFYTPLKSLIKSLGTSERALEKQSHLSRGCIRSILQNNPNTTLSSIEKLSTALNCEIDLIVKKSAGNSDSSSIGIGYLIIQDGFQSWKVHLMNFVDEYRRTLDTSLLLLSPPKTLDRRLYALIAGTTAYLCRESGIDIPAWALRAGFLETPWFPSEIESLKASAILESPIEFRRNNIFVLDNFLERV